MYTTNVEKFRWDFGDGSPVKDSKDASVAHAYKKSNDACLIKLTVFSISGDSATTTAQINANVYNGNVHIDEATILSSVTHNHNLYLNISNLNPLPVKYSISTYSRGISSDGTEKKWLSNSRNTYGYNIPQIWAKNFSIHFALFDLGGYLPQERNLFIKDISIQDMWQHIMNSSGQNQKNLLNGKQGNFDIDETGNIFSIKFFITLDKVL